MPGDVNMVAHHTFLGFKPAFGPSKVDSGSSFLYAIPASSHGEANRQRLDTQHLISEVRVLMGGRQTPGHLGSPLICFFSFLPRWVQGGGGGRK
jgi:hypothetical protein